MENVFSERLKQARFAAGMTQGEIKKALKRSHTTISLYESGKRLPRIDIAASIARALHVSLDWLVGLDDNKSPRPRTAEDCAQIMLDAISTWESQGLIDRIEIGGNARECLTIKLSNGMLLDFVRDWAKVHEMYAGKVIDQEIYDAWIEKRLMELAKIPLL